MICIKYFFCVQQYFEQHKNESERYQILLESDMGTFNPKGIGFTGSDTATCIMKEIIKLTASINTTEVRLFASKNT